jgi:hypothetical protein
LLSSPCVSAVVALSRTLLREEHLLDGVAGAFLQDAMTDKVNRGRARPLLLRLNNLRS